MKKIKWHNVAITLLILGVIAFAILVCSCTPTRKMVKPDNCYPKKEKVKYEMPKPEPKIKRND